MPYNSKDAHCSTANKLMLPTGHHNNIGYPKMTVITLLTLPTYVEQDLCSSRASTAATVAGRFAAERPAGRTID